MALLVDCGDPLGKEHTSQRVTAAALGKVFSSGSVSYWRVGDVRCRSLYYSLLFTITKISGWV